MANGFGQKKKNYFLEFFFLRNFIEIFSPLSCLECVDIRFAWVCAFYAERSHVGSTQPIANSITTLQDLAAFLLKDSENSKEPVLSNNCIDNGRRLVSAIRFQRREFNFKTNEEMLALLAALSLKWLEKYAMVTRVIDGRQLCRCWTEVLRITFIIFFHLPVSLSIWAHTWWFMKWRVRKSR